MTSRAASTTSAAIKTSELVHVNHDAISDRKPTNYATSSLNLLFNLFFKYHFESQLMCTKPRMRLWWEKHERYMWEGYLNCSIVNCYFVEYLLLPTILWIMTWHSLSSCGNSWSNRKPLRWKLIQQQALCGLTWTGFESPENGQQSISYCRLWLTFSLRRN